LGDLRFGIGKSYTGGILRIIMSIIFVMSFGVIDYSVVVNGLAVAYRINPLLDPGSAKDNFAS